MYVNLKLGTPTQFFFKFLSVSTCNVYSATGLKCFLLHSCGQALRNVSKLHKLYFVTTCGSKWLACFQNSSIFITLIKKKKQQNICMHTFSTKCPHLFHPDLNVLSEVALGQFHRGAYQGTTLLLILCCCLRI